MDFSKVISGAEKVLNAIDDLAPVAKLVGGSTVDNVVSLIHAGTSIVSNALERGKALGDAFREHDEGRLRSMLSDLQAKNDRLAELVDAS